MKRYYLLFEGRVQGVGFRWTLSSLAHKYNIVGYCKNLENGSVEAEIEGNSENLDAFFKEVLEFSRTYIRIDNYNIREINPQNDHIFEVKY